MLINSRHALPALEKLKSHYIRHLSEIEIDGRLVEPPRPLPWYPNEMAWEMTTPKAVLRRLPPFAEFQKFLVSETTVGNISRQEVVSMIPPLVLDVQPGMTVLDLCAAPGSKTAQLIEMVHDGEETRILKVLDGIRRQEGRETTSENKVIEDEITEERESGDWSDYGRSTGLVVANDVDYKRSHLLIHQTKRLNSPNIIVTNHDATQFPSIRIGSEKDKAGHETNEYLKFDRVLADVPCSGDGTPRKNPNLWKDWTPGNSFGLHPVQCRILVRALQMLKVGGRVVYSTCSMHPVENEAVIASCIDRCGGLSKIDLLDTSNMLPGLKRYPGLKNWKVMDKTGRLWDSWKSVLEHKDQAGFEGLGKMTHTMFADYLSEPLPLERCIRVYPHQQDTGGFFIAILEKKAEIRARPEGQPKAGHAVETAKDLQAEKAMRKDDGESETRSSIMAIVDDIESTKSETSNPLPHIAAADKILPPTEGDEAELRNSVVAFEHPIDDQEPTIGSKRPADDSVEALAPTKKVKIHGVNGFSAHQSELPNASMDGERQAHWPPPPAANDFVDLPITEKPRSKDKFFEEPFRYIAPDQADLLSIYEFYGLDPRFPRDRFMVRNSEGVPAKSVYYTSNLVKTILQENEGKGFKFVHSGIKVFVKQDVPRPDICRWRIQTDGMPLLAPWVKHERVLKLTSKETFHKLLIEMFPKIGGNSWRELGDLGKVLNDADLGCYVLQLEIGEGDDAFSERMALPLWRSLASVNLMLPKEERKAMLLRIYNDTSPLIDTSNTRGQGNLKATTEAGDEDQRMDVESPAAADEEDMDDDESDGGVPLHNTEEVVVADDEKKQELENGTDGISRTIDDGERTEGQV